MNQSMKINLNLGYFPDCIFGRQLCDWNDFIFQSEPKAFMGKSYFESCKHNYRKGFSQAEMRGQF